MKKIVTILMFLMLVFSIVACNSLVQKPDDDDIDPIVPGVDIDDIMDDIEDMMATPEGFCEAIKKVSGISISFPKSVKSIGLASAYNEGALVTYGGMLVGNGASINKAEFDELVASMDSQLSGFIKTVDGDDTDMSVIWTSNTDSTKYFEAEYYEFDGTPMVSFSFNYTDRSLLTPWPSALIDQVVGATSGIPAYDGAYSNLEIEHSEEYPNSIIITLDGATEEELLAWLEALTNVGYTKFTDYEESYWSKSISDTAFIEVSGWYSEWYENVEINIYREVLDNVVWPAEKIEAQFGSKAAGKIPTVASATRRTFEVYDDDYSSIYIMNVVDQQLFDAYCEALEQNGFTMFYSWGTTNKEYEYVWDNYDKLEVKLIYSESDDMGNKYIGIYISYTPYKFFVNLPENVKISVTAKSLYSANVSEVTIVKIGEDWYIDSGSARYYYKFDAKTKMWSSQYAYKSYSTGEYSWRTSDSTYDRYEIDDVLKNYFESIGLYDENFEEWPEEYTRGGTKTVAGKSCVEYTKQGGRTYWRDEETGLYFDYAYSREVSGETQTEYTTITEYNTSIKSFADAGVADKLPT